MSLDALLKSRAVKNRMILADLIRKKSSGQVATAIPAIPVEQSKESAGTVANPGEVKTKHSDLADAHAAREGFEERAAIREFDGGFNRQEAERIAHDDLRAMVGAKW